MTTLTRFSSLVALLALVPAATLAAGPIEKGTVVRVASSGIESGWHEGHMVLDSRRCWMVQLHKPTQGGYTMLALSFVSAVEVARGTGWAPIELRPVTQAQPAECLEEGAD